MSKSFEHLMTITIMLRIWRLNPTGKAQAGNINVDRYYQQLGTCMMTGRRMDSQTTLALGHSSANLADVMSPSPTAAEINDRKNKVDVIKQVLFDRLPMEEVANRLPENPETLMKFLDEWRTKDGNPPPFDEGADTMSLGTAAHNYWKEATGLQQELDAIKKTHRQLTIRVLDTVRVKTQEADKLQDAARRKRVIEEWGNKTVQASDEKIVQKSAQVETSKDRAAEAVMVLYNHCMQQSELASLRAMDTLDEEQLCMDLDLTLSLVADDDHEGNKLHPDFKPHDLPGEASPAAHGSPTPDELDGLPAEPSDLKLGGPPAKPSPAQTDDGPSPGLGAQQPGLATSSKEDASVTIKIAEATLNRASTMELQAGTLNNDHELERP